MKLHMYKHSDPLQPTHSLQYLAAYHLGSFHLYLHLHPLTQFHFSKNVYILPISRGFFSSVLYPSCCSNQHRITPFSSKFPSQFILTSTIFYFLPLSHNISFTILLLDPLQSFQSLFILPSLVFTNQYHSSIQTFSLTVFSTVHFSTHLLQLACLVFIFSRHQHRPTHTFTHHHTVIYLQ